MGRSAGITTQLLAWRAGEPSAQESLFPLVYDELRRIAREAVALLCSTVLPTSRAIVVPFALAAALLLSPRTGWAQSLNDRAENVLANAAIGAATGGLRALIQRQPVRPAVLRSAVGGGLLSAGKQVAGRGYSYTGAAGRVITSLGIAAITSATEDTLAFRIPVGPLMLELRPRAEDRLRTRVNVWTTVVMTAAIADGDSDFDLQASLDAGAPVFTRPAHRMPSPNRAGFAHPGVIFLNENAALFDIDRREVLAHESIHILQWDAYHALATYPLERVALRRLTRNDRLNRLVELHVLAPLSVAGLAELIPRERHRPWEREAYRLTRAIEHRIYPTAYPRLR